MDTVFLDIKAVENGSCHLPASIISTAGTVDFTGFFGVFAHGLENGVELGGSWLFDHAFTGTVRVFTQIIFQIELFELFVEIFQAALWRIEPGPRAAALVFFRFFPYL